jgi:hypothetical protein
VLSGVTGYAQWDNIGGVFTVVPFVVVIKSCGGIAIGALDGLDVGKFAFSD